MDALYGDLENYNEVLIVEELRNENKDLKLKVEKYETAMEKLQKDYDKLVLEFNSLQTNYSSLLRTARAEVERKAQMITQLNTEKDMNVLKTLQRGNNRRFRNRLQSNIQNVNKKTDNEAGKPNFNKKAKHEHNADNTKNERCKTSNIHKNVSVPDSHNTKLLNIVDKVVEKVDTCISKDEQKENVSENPKTLARIRDRRKSIPSPNTNADCGSDKTNNLQLNAEKPTEVILDTSNINEISSKVSNDKLSTKTSDTTSWTDRSSNCQKPAKEGYRSRSIRYFDSEKFRESDRVRESDRFCDKTGEINKYREGEKFRESFKHRKEDKYRGSGQSIEGDLVRESTRYREGDKYREMDKFGPGFKYRDSDKFRDDIKFRENEKFRESDKFKEHKKYEEADQHRHSDRYKIEDNLRESNKYRESDRCREIERDKYRMTDKNRESDKFREEDKYRDSEKMRSRDKFDPSYRYRKHYSPDRPLKRIFREYQDHSRTEHRRYRVLDSPPPESHNPYHERIQDKQLFSEGHRLKNDKYKHHYAESPILSDAHDEPCRKRQKFEVEVHNDEDRRHHDRDPVIKASYSKEYDTYASCQSPDAVFSPDSYTETTLAHIVTEIKSTAATPLEDPRVSSKKYVLKTESGKTTLTTASKCIDIKPIDKSLWPINSVPIPVALLHEPESRIGEEHIKEIYMDTNTSVEPGEILEDTVSSNADQEKVSEKSLQVNNVKQNAANDISNQKTKLENVPKASTEKKINKVIKHMPNNDFGSASDVTKDLPNIVCDNHLTKKFVIDSQSSTTPQPGLPEINEHENPIPKTTKISLYQHKKDEHNGISLLEMAMVQDDLELSDETSDNLDLEKQIVIAKEVLQQRQTTGKERKVSDLGSETKNMFKIATETDEIVNIDTNEALKESDGRKKHKSKRRKSKSKETEVCGKNDVNVSEKKTKHKKDMKPKQIKQFTELFGDSSSLITPEDLGIPASCVPPPPSEDAQDAIDINIKEIVMTPHSCPNVGAQNGERNENHPLIEVTYCKLGDTTKGNKENAKIIDDPNPRSDIDLNIVYQNLNAEADINKPNVVKTVIISSGVQPQFMLDNEKQSTEEERDVNNGVSKQINVDCNQPSAGIELKKQISLKALATSTPHKEFPIHKTTDIISGTADSVSIANDSTSRSASSVASVVDQSDTNTQTSLDAPDVRIFVRRRRKAVKKT